MKYLYKETNEFPLKVEEFKNENYLNYFFRLIKDYSKTLLFNVTNKNYFPNNSNYAVNNEGVLEQDYFVTSSHWVNIVSIERLKTNYKIEKITKEAKALEENTNQILEFTKEVKNMEEKKKIEIVETLWKIIYSNNEADIYETNLMRRLGGLMYIDNKIMGDIKEKIKTQNQ